MNVSDNPLGSRGSGHDPDSSRLREAVSTHPFFQGMSAEHLDVLADAAMESEFQEGESIFRTNDPANRFYLILSGAVLLGALEGDAKTIELQRVKAGEVLGWSWLFPPYQWHFDAIAASPTKAIFFYGTRLREQCDEDPALGYELMKRMALVVINRLQSTRRCLLEARK